MVAPEYKLCNLDRRYKGHSNYTHRLDFIIRRDLQPNNYQRNILKFCEAREVLFSLLGPGVEVDYAGILRAYDNVPLWAWDTTSHQLHIFMNEKEFLMFQLAFT